MNQHSEEQGLRVHHLVNLGGLIAVAGLDREPRAPEAILPLSADLTWRKWSGGRVSLAAHFPLS